MFATRRKYALDAKILQKPLVQMVFTNYTAFHRITDCELFAVVIWRFTVKKLCRPTLAVPAALTALVSALVRAAGRTTRLLSAQILPVNSYYEMVGIGNSTKNHGWEQFSDAGQMNFRGLKKATVEARGKT